MEFFASSRRVAGRSRVLVPTLFAALLLRALVPHGVAVAAAPGGFLPYCDGGYLRVALPGSPRGARAGVEHAVCGHAGGQCLAGACTPRILPGGLFALLVAVPGIDRGRPVARFARTLPPARAPPPAQSTRGHGLQSPA